MRTLTFPLRASLRGPQLQDGGGGAYMNHTWLLKKSQILNKGPDASSAEYLGRRSVYIMEKHASWKQPPSFMMISVKRRKMFVLTT